MRLEYDLVFHLILCIWTAIIKAAFGRISMALEKWRTLIEEDLLASNQTFLQSLPDQNIFDRTLQTNRHRGIPQTARSELIGLSEEGFSKALVIALR